MNPEPNYGDNSSAPAPMDAQRIESQRAELEERIRQLTADLELIQKGKEAAERSLRYERERAREIASNGMLSLKYDWVALANEFRILKGETIGTDERDNREYQEAKVIDFENRFRIGALALLEEDDDETLFVKARAYEISYRACTAMMANRNLRVKLDRRDSFEESKKLDKEKRLGAEREKLEKKRALSPDEKLFQACLTMGMSDVDARQHIAKMKELAKNITTKQ